MYSDQQSREDQAEERAEREANEREERARQVASAKREAQVDEAELAELSGMKQRLVDAESLVTSYKFRKKCGISCPKACKGFVLDERGFAERTTGTQVIECQHRENDQVQPCGTRYCARHGREVGPKVQSQQAGSAASGGMPAGLRSMFGEDAEKRAFLTRMENYSPHELMRNLPSEEDLGNTLTDPNHFSMSCDDYEAALA